MNLEREVEEEVESQYSRRCTMKFVVPDDIRNDARNIISPDPV
jgi:hypothetical protein